MSSQRPSWEPGAGEKRRMLFKKNLGTAGLIAPSVEFTSSWVTKCVLGVA